MQEIFELLSHLVERGPELFAHLCERIPNLDSCASPDSCTTSTWQRAMDFVRLVNFTSWLKGKFKKQEKGASSHSQNKHSDAPTSALDTPSSKGQS